MAVVQEEAKLRAVARPTAMQNQRLEEEAEAAEHTVAGEAVYFARRLKITYEETAIDDGILHQVEWFLNVGETE